MLLEDILNKAYLSHLRIGQESYDIEYVLNYSLNEDLDFDENCYYYDFQDEKESTVVSLDIYQELKLINNDIGHYQAINHEGKVVDLFFQISITFKQ